MQVVLVRHGDTDYTHCAKRGFFGLGINLAPLSELGLRQAEDVAGNEKLKGADIIVSSPYTRAMQTASIISRIANIPLIVDEDMHEWLPDLNFSNKFEEEKEMSADFLANEGKWPYGETRRWEPIDRLSHRVTSALKRYTHYDKIVVVCHAIVIYHLSGIDTIPHCLVAEIDFTDDFKPAGWFVKSK